MSEDESFFHDSGSASYRAPRISELNEVLSGPHPTPCRAKYGFTLYLGSTAGFVVYIIWAVVPKLETGGLEFAFPSRYWAVALPIWILVTLATVAFLFYPTINATMAPEPSSPLAISDSYSKQMPEGEPNDIPQIYDMDPVIVSRLLYLGEDVADS